VLLGLHRFAEEPWDHFGMLLFGSAALSAAPTYAERDEEGAKWQLALVELPWLLGSALVVLFKYFLYSESSDAFHTFLVKKVIIEWGLPDKGREVRELQDFWHGVTVGVLMIQLLSAQVASMVIRVQTK
jgi:hypothetical protein